MARSTKKGSPTRGGKAKPAKSVPRKNAVVARKTKAVRKAPTKAVKAKPAKASKAKSAKGKSKTSAPAPKHDAKHEHHMEEIRRQVARRRPGSGPDDVLHAQKDPSIVAPPGPPAAPTDSLHQNWGETRQKTVTRMDKPTNWYRQAPKQPSK